MKSIYKSISLTIFMFMILTSMYIYYSMYLPLKTGLEQETINSFEYTTYNKHMTFEKTIINNRYNAASISGRTGTSNYLAAYLDGQVFLEDLRSYTGSRYEEQTKDLENIELVARIASDGNVVHSVGTEQNYLHLIDWSRTEIYSEYLPTEGFIYVQSPIEKDDIILGYDIIITDFNPFLASLEDGIYDIGFIIGTKRDDIVHENGLITSYIYSEFAGGTLVVSVDESIVFSDLSGMKEFIAFLNFLGIIFLFLIVQFIILRLVRKFTTTQHQLKLEAEEYAQERNLLIEKMTKGFVVIKTNKNSEDLKKSYEIINGNDVFKNMINKSNEILKGIGLFEAIPMEDSKNINALIEAISVEDSYYGGQYTDCYIDGLNKWWTVSAYSPKEGMMAIICGDITEEKLLNEKIRESEETLRVVFDITGEGLWNLDIFSNTVNHNYRWNEIFAFNDKSISHTLAEYTNMIHPDDKEYVLKKINMCINEQKKYESEYRIVRPDGSVVWLVDRGAIIKDNKGIPIGMLGSVSDITHQKQAELELLKEKEMFQATLMSVGDGIVATDVNGIITTMNPIAESIVGCNSGESIGKSINDVFVLIDPTTKMQVNKIMFSNPNDILMNIDNKMAEDESVLLTSDNKEIIIGKKVSPITLCNGDMIGFVVAFRDVTLQHEKRKRIEYLSIHDELTGLFNRRHIQDVLSKFDTKSKLPLTVMIIDLNNLKLANDVFGHSKGDELLRKAAEFLSNTFGSEDIIGRIGGDEFCVILPKTSVVDAEEIKERIHKESYNYIADPINLSLAVGFATKTDSNEKIESIVREADANMYHDKQSSRKIVKEKLLSGFLHKNNENIISEEDHVRRVDLLAAALYKAIGKSKQEVSNFRKAVRLHDIGKIMIPKEIINKESELTEWEWQKIRTHSQASYQILRAMHEYEIYAEAILYHHENIDGTGYPQGLKGDEIPLESRVIAIADAYEAMTSDRPYRKALGKDEAIAELRRCSASQFDGSLVDIFIEEVVETFEI